MQPPNQESNDYPQEENPGQDAYSCKEVGAAGENWFQWIILKTKTSTIAT
jgi:hypothetical protein